jgi:thioredoxin-related protein
MKSSLCTCNQRSRVADWRRSLAAFSVLVFLLAGTPARAQQLQWRYDYNSARREAQEKNVPMVLEFSTENCFWCRKLEDTTLQDPQVLGTLSERFVALKVDPHRNQFLAEALRVQSFPTVVIAAPDGKILGTLEGYMEPARFQEHLQRALVSVGNPEWMTRDYDEASKAIAASDYGRAVALLKSVVQDGQQRPAQVKAKQLLADLEQQAANRLARARQLEDRGQSTEALDVVADVVRAYAGTQAAGEGGQMLTSLAAKPEVKARERTRRARELLGQAREDYRTQQFLGCMDRCEVLATSYGDLPEGVEALQLVAEIKSNPEWMRQACDALSERLGGLYLSLAEAWVKKGQPQQAIFCLERVVHAFPGTRQADAAQTRLGQLQGQPTRRADFKKP